MYIKCLFRGNKNAINFILLPIDWDIYYKTNKYIDKQSNKNKSEIQWFHVVGKMLLVCLFMAKR